MRVWFGVDHNKAGKGTTYYMSDKLVELLMFLIPIMFEKLLKN